MSISSVEGGARPLTLRVDLPPGPAPITLERKAVRRRFARFWSAVRSHVETRERLTATVLFLGIVATSIGIIACPVEVPWMAFMPLVVLSGALHSPRWHAGILGATFAAVMITAAVIGNIKTDGPGTIAALIAVGATTLWRSMSRARVGVQGSRGDSMLAYLRSRLVKRSHIPDLPAPWHGQACVESAYAQPFSGDFVVTRRTHDGHLLESVLVDVSGKGLDAGTRSLLLSGAFDALLGSLPPEEFLSAANDYVIRQSWSEGFATAIYLCVDLQTGEFAISSAGHPPALLHRAAGQRWAAIDGGCGPVLGLLPGMHYPSVRGRLQRGDAIMLYTDGLVEDRGNGVDEGITTLIGALDDAAGHDLARVTQRLCRDAPTGRSDDRGAVMVWSR
ncbi:PP2C family protein-serine/threonine phosphatase [Austwickia sp. TVS 96-490-7B]|uniref:PP2C family protein-serine/threonine phosphatase n=1 Tax=Austwickia sp. TVS 96-490-7B TaxID=2830843 RepID=UPI001C5A1B0C|nr:PP2C family protein-serine/threonine phosphatase [Austwickia sp. TVS 96-490-7B]